MLESADLTALYTFLFLWSDYNFPRYQLFLPSQLRVANRAISLSCNILDHLLLKLARLRRGRRWKERSIEAEIGPLYGG